MCGAQGTVASIKGSLSRRPDSNLAPLLPGSVAGGRAFGLWGAEGMAGVTKITAATFCRAPSIMPGTREIVTKHDPKNSQAFPLLVESPRRLTSSGEFLKEPSKGGAKRAPRPALGSTLASTFPANDTGLATALASLKPGLSTGSGSVLPVCSWRGTPEGDMAMIKPLFAQASETPCLLRKHTGKTIRPTWLPQTRKPAADRKGNT